MHDDDDGRKTYVKVNMTNFFIYSPLVTSLAVVVTGLAVTKFWEKKEEAKV